MSDVAFERGSQLVALATQLCAWRIGFRAEPNHDYGWRVELLDSIYEGDRSVGKGETLTQALSVAVQIHEAHPPDE